ncbi:MAG TPA: DNA-3-methyladenine glycosylase I [Acidimicrobiales bacterium]|nr:DNA-3-methyladenine glycosylase I [Acidimicrobiales bacterium]
MTDLTATDGPSTEPASTDLVTGDDGRARCAWGAGDALYVPYHDREWGRPLRDEQALFELLCLEAFQSGLAWITILRKRAGFRQAFEGFDAEVVADYGEADVARLMADAGIVRNRAKIDAAIANAQAVARLHDDGTTLVDVVFSHRPPPAERPRGRRFASFSEVPSATPTSTALSRDLRSRGFRFVGPVVAYALMQSAGVVDDHLEGCWVDV